MSALQETLVVSVFLAIVFGAVAFYLYSRMVYSEKRLSLIENMIMDMKMTIESADHATDQALPMIPPLPASAIFTPPAPLEHEDAEDIPEEKFYTSVLASVQEPAPSEEAELAQQLEAQQEAEAAALAATLNPVETIRPMKVVPNYDSMKKEELAKLAEQRGLRVKRTSGKGEIIAILRKNDANNTATSGAAENVPATEPVTSLLAAPADSTEGFALELDESSTA
jgi:hypothetical protein